MDRDLTAADLDALAALYAEAHKTAPMRVPSDADPNVWEIRHLKDGVAVEDFRSALHNAFPALLRMARSAEGLKHGGECLTDPYTKDVCEGMYAEKVDEVLALVQTLEGIATLSAGYSQESKELRKFALQGIAAQSTDIDAAGEARSELAAFDAARKP